MERKIKNLNELTALIGEFPRENKVILAHGCFDLCHPGHIRHFAYAKSKADILVVSLTADRHINKGIYRPHVPHDIRAQSISALEMVDFVIVTDAPDSLGLITELQPDYYAKGFEYSDFHHSATDAETKAVEGYGGQMVFTPGDVVYSSTKLLNTQLPELHIEKLQSLMRQFLITFDDLKYALNKFSNFKIHVVGDTIVDTYTRTNLIGSNAKTPTFSVLYDGHEDYVGGAGVVAQHLRAAGAKVSFTTILGRDDLGKFSCDTLEESGIFTRAVFTDRPTTHKNSIIAGDSRLLKIDTLDNSIISGRTLNELAMSIDDISCDCIVFSDFRHGIFSKSTLPVLIDVIPENVFRVADSQVASRWGNITEFKGFDLITPNEKEARFALADQDSNIGRLITATRDAAQAKNIILKLGARGAFFLEKDIAYSVDSFTRCVKDAVGAGDALLAYSTLTMLATKSMPMACIIGSIAAACECEIDGNIPIKPELVLQKISQLEKTI